MDTAIFDEIPTVKQNSSVQCGNLVCKTGERPCWKKFILRIFAKEVVAATRKIGHVSGVQIWLAEGVEHLWAELGLKYRLLGYQIWLQVGLVDSVIGADMIGIKDFNSDNRDLITNSEHSLATYNIKVHSAMAGGKGKYRYKCLV